MQVASNDHHMSVGQAFVGKDHRKYRRVKTILEQAAPTKCTGNTRAIWVKCFVLVQAVYLLIVCANAKKNTVDRTIHTVLYAIVDLLSSLND